MYGEHEVYVNTDDVRHKTKAAKLVEFNFEEASATKMDEKDKIKV